MNMLVLLAAGALTLPRTAAAATYYVTPDGSDSAAGTTADAAWMSLAAASKRLGDGDTLLLQRGGQWLDEWLNTSASGLTVGAYGPSTGPTPLIQHGRPLGDAPGSHACLNFLSADGLTVSDIHLSGCAGGLHVSGPPRGGPSAGNATDVLIQRLFFQDIRTPFLLYNPPNPRWASAVNLAGSFKNFTLRNCVAVRIDVFFRSSAWIDGMHLSSNTVQQCSGNCYGLGGGVDLVMEDSVFLRDMSTRLFMYGTTDIIVGGLTGTSNKVINTDFNARGEYQGGPDGCAFDFETGATGFEIRGNYFYRSWGAGIMIFGHDQTSHGITLTENVFAYDGCIQNRGDKGGIAIMCPGGHKPDGLIANNEFFTCPNVSAIFVNPAIPGCADNMVMKNNTIQPASQDPRLGRLVAMPQVSFNPPAPTDNATSGVYNVIGVSDTAGAIIRYTLDGSRPSETSSLLDPKGINLLWPGPALVVNMRAFKDGLVPSVTNGAVMELNYVLGRMAPHPVGGLAGKADGFSLATSTVTGWVVDSLLPKMGIAPVTVVVSVDGTAVSSVLANEPRPDLVEAGVAPNPEHGFTLVLPAAAAATLESKGKHVLEVHAIGTPSCGIPTGLSEGSEFWVCDGKQC